MMKWTKANKNKVKKLVEYDIHYMRYNGFDVRELENIKFTHAMNTHGWCMTYSNNHKFTLGISCYRVADGEEAVKETILHELCHAIASHGAGHGKEWQDIADKVGHLYGIKIQRCEPHSITVEENAYRYVAKCDKCGAIWRRMRKTAFIKAGMTYTAITRKCACGGNHFSMVKGEN